MSEFNSDVLQGTLEFFILNTLDQEPLHSGAVERRMQRVFSMLEVAAVRRHGKFSPGSLENALSRLEHAGWVQVSRAPVTSGPGAIYSLTSMGRKQLEAERGHRTSKLTGTIEEGALDDSFRQFLSRSQ